MTLIEKAVATAEEMMYNDYRINAGVERKVVTKDWEKDGQKRTYIKVYCYTLNGKFKGSYDMGYVDTVANEYVAGEFDLAISADELVSTEEVLAENEDIYTDTADGEIILGRTVRETVKYLLDHSDTKCIMIDGVLMFAPVNLTTDIAYGDYAKIRQKIVVDAEPFGKDIINLITHKIITL